MTMPNKDIFSSFLTLGITENKFSDRIFSDAEPLNN